MQIRYRDDQWLWLADALKDHTLSIELLNCCMT